jgi:hypothetical protein
VTVAPEPSKTIITIPVFDATTGNETGNTPTSIGYGTPAAVRVDVGNANAKATFPSQVVCAQLACPTGNITLSDSINGTSMSLSPSGGFPLNSGGYALDYNVPLFSGGPHQFSASYPGDNSFNPSSSTYALTVTPAATRIISSNPPLPPIVATPFGVGAIVTMNIFGAMPSCNFTFYDGATTMQGTSNCTWQANGPFLYAGMPVSQTTAGTHTYSVKFNGDPNYAPSTSTPMTTQVFYGTMMNLAVDKPIVQYGSTVTLTGTVDSTVMQGPAMANTIKFLSGADAVPGSVTYTPVKDPLGNTALQGSVTFTPQTNGWYYAYFPGDSNYYQSNSNSTFITVNIPGFSVAANQNSNLAITAGQSATTTITVTPATNSTSPVALACYLSDIPGSSCNFSPSTLMLGNSNPANATLTISVLPPSTSNTVTSAPTVLHSLPSSKGWKVFVLTAGLAGLYLLTLMRGPQLNRRARAFGLACLLGAVSISCGVGGGTNGGSSGPIATSLSLSTSAIRAPSTTPPTIQAKVNSSQPVTGLVLFYDGGNNVNTAPVLADGTAIFPLAGYSAIPGTHVITASYSGDSNNMSSKTSGALNQVITGTTYMGVSGTTGGLTESASFSVTIQ